MTKLEKLIAKVKTNPHNVRFSQLESILNSHGFYGHSQRGSHVAFQNRSGRTIVIVKPHSGRKECIRSDVLKVVRILGL